jgi:hypothetical protein
MTNLFVLRGMVRVIMHFAGRIDGERNAASRGAPT